MGYQVEGIRVIDSRLKFTEEVEQFDPIVKEGVYEFPDSAVELFEVSVDHAGFIEDVRFGGVGSGDWFNDLVDVLKVTEGAGLMLVMWDDGSAADVLYVEGGRVWAYDLGATVEYLSGDVQHIVRQYGDVL